METHAQHFNITQKNDHGYYGGIKEKNPKRGPRAKPYHCDRIIDTSWQSDWRNDLVWNLLPKIEKKYSKLNNIYLSVLHIRSLTLPLYNMHMHGDYPDCTHYCVTPMMYQPIFYELSLAAKKIK